VRQRALAAALAALAALAVYVVLTGRAPEAPPAPAPVPAAETPTPAQDPVSIDAAQSDAQALASGAALVLDAASLRPGEPVKLRLDLATPSDTDEPRPVRVAAEDGRSLELAAPLGAERREARVELDPGFLKPGRYLVEVETTEKSHFPIRRYVLVIR
jgi:hypothetical protein